MGPRDVPSRLLADQLFVIGHAGGRLWYKFTSTKDVLAMLPYGWSEKLSDCHPSHLSFINLSLINQLATLIWLSAQKESPPEMDGNTPEE